MQADIAKKAWLTECGDALCQAQRSASLLPWYDRHVFRASCFCRGCGAQVLASIGQLEFFYDQAPDVMRSCSMALQLLVCLHRLLPVGRPRARPSPSVTYRLGCDWLPQDLNYGRLDLFFLLLAGEQRPGAPWRSSGDLLP